MVPWKKSGSAGRWETKLFIGIALEESTLLLTVKLCSENEVFNWSLNSNSNNNRHFLTICYCMFVYGWLVLELRFWLFILCFYPMGTFVLRADRG